MALAIWYCPDRTYVKPAGLDIAANAKHDECMKMLVQWPDGSILPAILISTVGGRLRAAIPGCEDAVDFQWADGQWMDENGEIADIQFDAEPELFDLCVKLSAGKGENQEAVPGFNFERAHVAMPVSSAYVN